MSAKRVPELASRPRKVNFKARRLLWHKYLTGRSGIPDFPQDFGLYLKTAEDSLRRLSGPARL